MAEKKKKKKKYYTIYNWTYTDFPSDPKDPGTIGQVTWVPIDQKLTITGNNNQTKQMYFYQVLNLAAQEGIYYTVSQTVDCTNIDGSAYQYYGKSGKIPIIQSIRQQIQVQVSDSQ